MSSPPNEHALGNALRLVLVEDDAADQLLFVDTVSGAVHEAGVTDLDVSTVIDLQGLNDLLVSSDGDRPECVVLDLGLAGLSGLETLDAVLDAHPDVAVVVLTGWGDEGAGSAAVARGAQDFLVKGRASGEVILRSIRFAIERKRHQLALVALESAKVREAERVRLERALLAAPAVFRDDVHIEFRYAAARPGLVSGDFFDAVECDDGSIRVVIGDVSGHGADEAALGVALRSAWRALVLAGLDGAATLDALDALVRAERIAGDEFATVCDLAIPQGLDEVTVRSAGHPPPVLAGKGVLTDQSLSAPAGVPLAQNSRRGGTTYPLPVTWSLVVFSDGLFEVRDRDTQQILDVTSVAAAVGALDAAGRLDPGALIESFEERTDEGWRDDVAVALISRTS